MPDAEIQWRRGPRARCGQPPMRAQALILAWCVALGFALASAGPAAAAPSWWNKDWPYRKEIVLDASPKGGNLVQSAGRVAVLVRLHSGNFKFGDAEDNGADLRFVGEDGKTPLAFQVETYDPLLGVAAVWVDVPRFPTGAAKSIWLYWGNKKAPPAADPTATFDPDYSLVYHFDSGGGAPVADTTANHNASQTPPAGIDEASIVGRGAKFAGTGPLVIPASPSLAVAAGGPFTFSAWVKTSAPQPRAALYVRRDAGGSLVVGLDNGVPFVELGGQHAQAPSPITGNQWTHLAVTADGKAVVLYVGGRAAATLAGALPALSTPTALGGDTQAGSNLAAFNGEMDEARISKVARPAALIAVDASLQGADSKFIAYGPDPKQAGIGFGPIGLVITHVDAPAWFIIALLGVLAAGSWFVMWTKLAYVNRVDRANDAFLEYFHEQGGAHPTTEDPAVAERFEDSSIHRVWAAGADEIGRRAKRGQSTVTEQGIEVVRSLMNTRLVRENQALSSAMVVLTIAISGGPFLGLLGTVVGVMITFADVAAAGDVNINAIAPGISAALLATIAGLFVAIPALFGYNYILLRNKNVSANMLVFVDEFITRISESHRASERRLAAE